MNFDLDLDGHSPNMAYTIENGKLGTKSQEWKTRENQWLNSAGTGRNAVLAPLVGVPTPQTVVHVP